MIVGLRTLHIVAVIGLGAHLLGAPAPPLWPATGFAGIVLASGAAMFALDLRNDPSHLRRVAGIAVVLKLVLTAAIALTPDFALTLFWILVTLSAVISHAPKRFRHHIVLANDT